MKTGFKTVLVIAGIFSLAGMMRYAELNQTKQADNSPQQNAPKLEKVITKEVQKKCEVMAGDYSIALTAINNGLGYKPTVNILVSLGYTIEQADRIIKYVMDFQTEHEVIAHIYDKCINK